MPLPQSVRRDVMHVREIECKGYLRADGLWDIEGHLKDTKGYDFDNFERGTVRSGEPVHEMWLRLTVDDTQLIHDVEAVTDYAPFGICSAITPVFKQLIGLRVEAGWTRKARRIVRGVKGCTHLVELLGPLGTTVFQTVRKERNRHTHSETNGIESDQMDESSRRPLIIDTCHALKADGEAVKMLWPDFYEGE
jgi:hypothetical protein